MPLDYLAFRYNGHPVSIATPTAISYAREAAAMLDVLQNCLAHPIASILRPPRTCKSWDQQTHRLIDVPGPSPRAAAQHHASTLGDATAYINEQLTHAQGAARYKVAACEAIWGDPPQDLLIKVLDLPGDFKTHLEQSSKQLARMTVLQFAKLDLLHFALGLVEHYPNGETFRAKELCRLGDAVAVQIAQRRLHQLKREPDPLVDAGRDHHGTFWFIRPSSVKE